MAMNRLRAVLLLVLLNAVWIVQSEEVDKVEDWRAALMDCMNNYRAKHQVGPLENDPDLEQQAQEWAEKLAEEGKLKHQQDNEIGENTYMYKGGDPPMDGACQKWYAEVKLYDFNNPGYSKKTGHFTQLVWKSTNLVGLGIANVGEIFAVVADFKPPGNYDDEFEDNVFESNE